MRFSMFFCKKILSKVSLSQYSTILQILTSKNFKRSVTVTDYPDLSVTRKVCFSRVFRKNTLICTTLVHYSFILCTPLVQTPKDVDEEDVLVLSVLLRLGCWFSCTFLKNSGTYN